MTREQELAKLLIIALHRMGGSMEVSRELLDHMGTYQLVWGHREDSLHLVVEVKAGELLIASVDNDEVTVVL